MTIDELRRIYAAQINALSLHLGELRDKYPTLESRDALPGGAYMQLLNQEARLNEELTRLKNLSQALWPLL